MAEMTREEIEALVDHMDRFGGDDFLTTETGGHMRASELAILALRQLLKEREWRPIESAPKDKEIVALSKAWDNEKRPIMLRWLKYNGTEAWRDWDGDPHYPSVYVLPPEPQRQLENRCQADTEQGEGKGSAAERLPSGQAGVSADAENVYIGPSGERVTLNAIDDPVARDFFETYKRAALDFERAQSPKHRYALQIIYSCVMAAGGKLTIKNSDFIFPSGDLTIDRNHADNAIVLTAQREIEKRAQASADDAQRAERLPDTNNPEAD